MPASFTSHAIRKPMRILLSNSESAGFDQTREGSPLDQFSQKRPLNPSSNSQDAWPGSRRLKLRIPFAKLLVQIPVALSPSIAVIHRQQCSADRRDLEGN